MKTSDFLYELPEELIAQTPAANRSDSRLMVLDRYSGSISHRVFAELPDLLRPGDCLVLNNSRVLPARLIGNRPGGGEAELLLLRDMGAGRWECLARPGRKIKPGTKLSFGSGELTATVLGSDTGGRRTVEFEFSGVFMEVLERLGQMPLPPYIRTQISDNERYQTVYSREPGSAAAPTAGLHFTNELLDTIRSHGVHIAEITLHVGLGTFRPVQTDDIEKHEMHSEFCVIPEHSAKIINDTKEAGCRVIAVGTTSCRTLESFADTNGRLDPTSGWTDIFIYPGYKFKLLDGLITNFHLPGSTLVMLVSALAGRDRILDAYSAAVEERYRFYSFGDAMMIV